MRFIRRITHPNKFWPSNAGRYRWSGPTDLCLSLVYLLPPKSELGDAVTVKMYRPAEIQTHCKTLTTEKHLILAARMHTSTI